MNDGNAEHEAARIEALEALGILDTPPEPEFDELAGLASAICGTPISLVSLVDRHRQWFKATVGLQLQESDREIAFCAHAIQQRNLFVVEDAHDDHRFSANPLVTGEPHVRFYAGMPLLTPDGFALGTLCVIDSQPRQLTTQQKNALSVLARQVSAMIELRSQKKALHAVVAEKDQVAVRLRASEDLFRVFMNNSPAASYIKDANGQFLFRNARFTDVFGEDAKGQLVASVPGHENSPEEHELIERIEVVRNNGQTTHWRSFSFPCHDAEGKPLVGGVAIEITGEILRNAELARYQAELEAANDRLRDVAVTDELTGLRNRRAFEERLASEFSAAQRKGRKLSVVVMDADDFKTVNDRFGHHAGDSVLQQLARVLENSVRVTDLAVRYGGEEFAVILPDSDERSALMWCRRLHKALAEVPWVHRAVTVSMGVAAIQPECIDGAHLVAMADQALYRAKHMGKNCSVGAEEAKMEMARQES